MRHVVNGKAADAVQFAILAGTLLPKLPVNNASERGLLGIALDPRSRQSRGLPVLDREWHRRRLGRPVGGRQLELSLPAGHDFAPRQPGRLLHL